MRPRSDARDKMECDGVRSQDQDVFYVGASLWFLCELVIARYDYQPIFWLQLRQLQWCDALDRSPVVVEVMRKSARTSGQA
jgi:hypothetical protein